MTMYTAAHVCAHERERERELQGLGAGIVFCFGDMRRGENAGLVDLNVCVCVCVTNLSQWEGGEMKGMCSYQFLSHAEIPT